MGLFIINMIFFLKLILYPFIIFYGALAVFAYRSVKKTLRITKTFKENKDLEIKPEWEGFVRQDFNKWDERSMIIGCFTRFPLKCMIMLFYTLSITIVIVLTTKHKRIGKKIQKFFVKYVGDLALWSILDIKQHCNPQKVSTPIIISNHVSWIDIVYLTKRIYPLAIVSKQAISKAPIVGTIAKDIQCLFILRQSEDARRDIMEKIQQRVNDYNQHKNVNPLLIFPQGTTSSGRALLKFKMGAFASKPKITMFGLRYDCQGFDMGMDQINTLEHFIIALCMRPKLTVNMMEVQPNQNEDPKDYMLRCQKLMSELTGFRIYNASYAERQIFKEMREGTKRQ